LRDGTDGTSFPFCSPRCKTIDLGAWLDERYRMPTEDSAGNDDDDGDLEERRR